MERGGGGGGGRGQSMRDDHQKNKVGETDRSTFGDIYIYIRDMFFQVGCSHLSFLARKETFSRDGIGEDEETEWLALFTICNCGVPPWISTIFVQRERCASTKLHIRSESTERHLDSLNRSLLYIILHTWLFISSRVALFDQSVQRFLPLFESMSRKL